MNSIENATPKELDVLRKYFPAVIADKQLEEKNIEQPCYVTHDSPSKVTWEDLNKKVDEILLLLSGYCHEDIKMVASSLIIKSKKLPIEIKK